MKVLVTGGAGRLGSVVCARLAEQGWDVLATDQRYGRLSVPQRLADLRDASAVYPLLEGRDAVVHLGNIPSLGLGHPPQVVLSDNASMNANVFEAAVELGVTRLVFASSIQAMLRFDEGRAAPPPYRLPYLPLDGRAPADPGHNCYALSKELGERLLRVLSDQHPRLACTALRFPHLAGKWLLDKTKVPQREEDLNFSEALTYLELADAALVVERALQRQAPGYHQYLPAQSLTLRGYDVPELLRTFFAHVPLRAIPEQLTGLVDHRELEQDLALRPAPPLTVLLTRP